jgi:hypothetical protein
LAALLLKHAKLGEVVEFGQVKVLIDYFIKNILKEAISNKYYFIIIGIL